MATNNSDWRTLTDAQPIIGQLFDAERVDGGDPDMMIALALPVNPLDAVVYTGRWRPRMIDGCIVTIPIHRSLDDLEFPTAKLLANDDLYRWNQREAAMRANERLAEQKTMQDMEAQCIGPLPAVQYCPRCEKPTDPHGVCGWCTVQRYSPLAVGAVVYPPRTRIGADNIGLDGNCRCDPCFLLAGYCETQVERLLTAARAVIQASDPLQDDPAMAELRAAIQMGEL